MSGISSPQSAASTLNPLIACGGLTIFEVARAIHIARIRRPGIVTWINQFAGRPGPWKPAGLFAQKA